MSQDLPCIYQAMTIEDADIVVAWLDNQGIEAFVKDRYAAGTMTYGLGFLSHPIKVVVRPEQADEARRLLAEYDAAKAQERSATASESVEAVCEECGEKSVFPGTSRGKVENCPKCGEYLDVPQ